MQTILNTPERIKKMPGAELLPALGIVVMRYLLKVSDDIAYRKGPTKIVVF